LPPKASLDPTTPIKQKGSKGGSNAVPLRIEETPASARKKGGRKRPLVERQTEENTGGGNVDEAAEIMTKSPQGYRFLLGRVKGDDGAIFLKYSSIIEHLKGAVLRG